MDLIAGVAAIIFGLGLIVAVPQLRHAVSLALHGHFSSLRDYIRSLGVGGLALLLALMFAHSLIWYPSEIVTATAGYVYGFVPGLALVLGGWLLAALITFAIGRAVGRPVLRAMLGHRFTGLERAIDRGGVRLLLASRLIPFVPFAPVGYAAGATRVSLWRFSWTTVVGFLPTTAAVVYFGSRAQSLSLSDPFVWVAALVLIVLLVSSKFVKIGHER